MNDATRLNQQFAVEVSGWDKEENFFVEHTRLDWNEHNHKKVVLRHLIRPGAIVFLRLIEPAIPPANLPVAFRAGSIQPEAGRACSEVHLDQLWPEQGEAGGKVGGPAAQWGVSARGVESLLRESFAPTRRQIP